MPAARDLQQRKVKRLWWSASLNRWRDQTGIAHVVHGGGTLCGARPFSMGGSYTSAAETGCQECKRCRKLVDKAATLAAQEGA